MRKKLIAANWKMNMTLSETEGFWTTFDSETSDTPLCEIAIAPPFTALAKLSELLSRSQKAWLAAQNMYCETSGAFTGEISPTMLRELFVRYVILGHSERRQIFGESNELINRKLLLALKSGLRPILCIGETLEERDAGRLVEILETQLRGCLQSVSPEQADSIVIAYEPVWAIGTGRNATPDQAQQAHKECRRIITEILGQQAAESMRVLYGGSVKPANAHDLLAQPDIDGALVGGASLDPRGFAHIVAAAENVEKSRL